MVFWIDKHMQVPYIPNDAPLMLTNDNGYPVSLLGCIRAC